LTSRKPPLRVAVKIERMTGANGLETFKATLPMGVLFEKSLDRARLEAEQRALEERYRTLLEDLQLIRAAMRSGNVLRYWEFGDAVARFAAENDSGILFLEKINQHLERDLGMSLGRLWVCETFRKRFPDRSKIDPERSITNYQRANFDPQHLPQYTHRRGRIRKRSREAGQLEDQAHLF
jgi:hypothetical protein